jgi:ABC-type sugar transport system substrate-binding protein
MSSTRKILLLLTIAALAAVAVNGSLPARAQTTAPPPQEKGGTYVILDKDFWAAMEQLSRSQGEVYGDRREPLLEKIALATQFMVKTNLTIIKQNERIIKLLEDINRNAAAQPRDVKP